MKVIVAPRVSRDQRKIFYSFEWGKKAGQRIATGVFTYAHPENAIQKRYNVEALQLVEVKKSQMILDALSIGTDFVPAYKYQCNFLDFYKDYVKHHQQVGNRHLECSYNQFKRFIKVDYISPKDISEEVSVSFQRYLLRRLNGETPSNYFTRYKRVLKAATAQGYFRVSPSQDIPVKANKNKRRKSNLEVDEYKRLLRTPALNENVRDAFIFCCYTGLRWCDVKNLKWGNIRQDSITFDFTQKKTNIEHYVTLHPIAKSIIDTRRGRLNIIDLHRRVFSLPTADGANKVLGVWCLAAGIEKHITWNCARFSFSILLQDASVDTATVALLLGHSTTKYVNETYKRYRPKDQERTILKLPVG